MRNTSIINVTVYSTELDDAIGNILSAASFLGTFSNITSFIYFSTLKPRNDNAIFFKRLYMIISLNDALVCIGILPFIEATFSDNRKSRLFDIELMCTVWFAYWWIVSHLSYVLVALLSVTRLKLLRRHSLRLKPWLAFLIPGLLATSYIIICCVAVPTNIMYTVYIPDLLQCTFTSWAPSSWNTTHSFNTSDGAVFIVLMLLFNSLTTSVFILVTVSFILSLHRLKKSTEITSLIGGSATRQREAAKTVIVVTLVYIVFNVPGMMVAMALAFNILFLEPERFQNVSTSSVNWFGDNPLANQYLMPVTGCMCVCLNSAVNPLVYFTRINGFRSYVKRLLVEVGAIVPRRIQAYQNSQLTRQNGT